MAGARDVLFRIFYSTTFTVVFLILFAFCVVTPIDKIYQSYRRSRLIDIFIIGGAYVITGCVAIFLYASRLYTNRSVLRDIPKTFMPIEKDDLPGKKIYRLIEESQAKSAVVAYHAKPRAKRIERELPAAGERLLELTGQSKIHRHVHYLTPTEEKLLEPQWGTIEHVGWKSPAERDMGGLEYAKVVDELVDLIEARAVNLAPKIGTGAIDEEDENGSNQSIVNLLTRPDNFGMRQYLAVLMEMGVVEDSSLTEAFTVSYERARFRADPLADHEFEALMRLFAELLRSMKPLDLSLISFSDSSDEEDESIGGGENHRHRDEKRLLQSQHLISSSKSSTFSASSITNNTNQHPPRRISEDSAPSMSSDELNPASASASPNYPTFQPLTRSATQRSTSRPSLSSRFFSTNSQPKLRTQPSQNSVKSARSGSSARSTGSVIRLRREGDESDLPYRIVMAGEHDK